MKSLVRAKILFCAKCALIQHINDEYMVRCASLCLHHAGAALALPSQPESSSVVLVWICDHTGRFIPCCAKQRAQGLHEDHPRGDGQGERHCAPGHRVGLHIHSSDV